MRGFCLVPCHPGRHSPDQKLCNCTFIDKVTRRATFHRIHRTTNFSNELVRQNVIEITWIHQMATQVSPPTNYPTNQPPHMRQLDLWPRFQSKYFNNVTRLSSWVLWRTPKELSRPSPWAWSGKPTNSDESSAYQVDHQAERDIQFHRSRSSSSDRR